MRHVLFGSIGVLAETSELQRMAFNEAFAQAGLAWDWSPEAYRTMLARSGGRARIEAYAEARGMQVDAGALHDLKSTIFQAQLDAGVPLRPGVAETMARVRAAGGKLAFVTTTSEQNVDAILAATRLSRKDFDLVLDARAGFAPKPAPDAYRHVLSELGIAADAAVAIEDNPDGVRAAQAAQIETVAFPGAYHVDAEFPGARITHPVLSLNEILSAA